MSLAIAKKIDRKNPELLQKNIGATNYQYLTLLIAELRAAGKQAFYVSKTQGESQYVPPGFGRVLVEGLDGIGYTVTGVSPDAIWCDGVIVDTIARANDGDSQIFEGGIPIAGEPVWNEIPRENWRAHNPPLPTALENGRPSGPATPVTPTTSMVLPDYHSMGDDQFFVDVIGAALEADMAEAKPKQKMNAGSASWIARAVYRMMTAFLKYGDHREQEAIVKDVRNQWRAVLKLDPL